MVSRYHDFGQTHMPQGGLFIHQMSEPSLMDFVFPLPPCATTQQLLLGGYNPSRNNESRSPGMIEHKSIQTTIVENT